jgi:hypothetical protein
MRFKPGIFRIRSRSAKNYTMLLNVKYALHKNRLNKIFMDTVNNIRSWGRFENTLQMAYKRILCVSRFIPRFWTCYISICSEELSPYRTQAARLLLISQGLSPCLASQPRRIQGLWWWAERLLVIWNGQNHPCIKRVSVQIRSSNPEQANLWDRS